MHCVSNKTPAVCLELSAVCQALSGLNFSKFKEAVENYTFQMTKPPKNDDAFQQVRHTLQCCACSARAQA